MESPAIDRLPDEVLVKVFLNLSPVDVLTRVLPVCRRWQDAAQSKVLGKHLMFAWDAVSAEKALRLIARAPNLQSLQLVNRTDAAKLLQAVGCRCPELRRLTVVDWYRRRSALSAALGAVIRSCGNLTAFSLTGVDIDNGLQLCQELGTALPKLRRLTIDCDWFGPAELDAVLGSCHQIQQFRAIWCRCSDANMSRLAQRWGWSLQVLELNIEEATDGGVAALAGCSQLRNLKLTDLNTPGAGLLQLASLSHLEQLELYDMARVEPENIRQFFTQSRSTGQLREIRLMAGWLWANRPTSRTAIDDSVLTALAAACPNVQCVALSVCTHVTDAGVRELLRRCRRLLRLTLSGTDYSIAQVLLELPQLAPQLRGICLQSINSIRSILGASAVESVLAEMPHLELRLG